MLQCRWSAYISKVVEVGHRGHPFRRRSYVAQPPTCDGKRLGEAGDDYGSLPHSGQRGGRNMLRPVIDEILINLIGKQEKVVRAYSLGDDLDRSEERRVGKECRSRRWP